MAEEEKKTIKSYEETIDFFFLIHNFLVGEKLTTHVAIYFQRIECK